MKLDVASIVTGLLHDTVEDTYVSIELIEDQFGAEIAQLVDGASPSHPAAHPRICGMSEASGPTP